MATEELMERLRAFSSDKVVLPHIRVAVAEAMDAVERMGKEIAALRRMAHCLESGVQSVVNLQSHLTRAQVREAMSDLLDRCGLDCPGMPDQSPLVARATAAEARVAQLETALKGLDAPWIQFINCWADPSGIAADDAKEEKQNVRVLAKAMDAARTALSQSPDRESGT